MTKAKKQKITKTQQILFAMLTENTGRSLCDSGGEPKYVDGKYVGSEHGFGRAYERNAGRNFLLEPEVTMEVDICQEKIDLVISANLFHWLDKRVTYDGRMQGVYNRFAARPENADENHMDIMQAFPLALRDKGKHVAGWDGDEDSEFKVTYTYNEETMLSQDIQYVLFEVDSVLYAAIQIHNGCDARGGLTAPKIFRVDVDGVSFLIDMRDVDLEGTPDDGRVPEGMPDRIVWGSENAGGRFHLEEYYPEPEGIEHDFDTYPVSEDKNLRGQGIIVIDKEKNQMWCPVTGWELTPSVM